MAASVVSALFGSYDLRMAKQWRDEDIVYRDQEIQWLNDDIVRAHQWRSADVERFLRTERIENEHLVCEARAEQLSAVSEQCALLFGFTVAAMTNLDLPAELHEALLFAFGVSATVVCVSMLTTTVMCTTLLLAVTRYVGHALEENVKQMALTHVEWDSPFSAWWLRTCEREQMTAYKFMLLGVSVFFFYLGVIAWIQFRHSVWASSSISLLCLAGFLTWQLRVASKWRYLLHPPSSRISVMSAASTSSGVSVSMSALASPMTLLSSPPVSVHRSPHHTQRKSALREGGPRTVRTTEVLLSPTPITAYRRDV